MLPITENFFHQNNVTGDFVSLKTSDARHNNGRAVKVLGEDPGEKF